MASKQRKNSTIYENSTVMAVNLLRTSSLALAEMTVGRRGGGRLLDQRVDAAHLPSAQGVRRLSVQPERHTTTYLRADPNTATATATATVDAAAEEFIRRVREKIRKGASGPT